MIHALDDISISRISLLLVILLPIFIFGETPVEYDGIHSCKYLKNYGPDDYLLQPQNWCIIQDKQGIIYAANQGGLLEFDGVTWKIIDIANAAARSLAIDDNRTIYVGGRDEIGFLAPDKKGLLTYRSLVSHLDNNYRNFDVVKKTHATQEGIYFWTTKFLIRWDPVSQKMKVWDPKPSFSASFTCKGKLYLYQQNVGLMQMINDSPVLLAHGEIFAGANIIVMVPYDDYKILLGTTKGFYLYDVNNSGPFTPFPFGSGVDAYLEEKQLYSAARLSNGNFALTTRSGGLVIMDARGKLKEIIDKTSGLQDNSVWFVFQDLQGNLWLALNKGITKIEYASPFSIYDEKSANLPGIVLSVARHGPQKELYAGVFDGLFIQSSSGKFNPVPGVPPGLCWSLLSRGDSLLAAANQGIFQLKNNTVNKIIDITSYALVQSQQDSNRIWVGTREGLIALRLDESTGRWTEEHKYQNINQDIKTIVEDPQGNLWLGTITQGVLYVAFPGGKIKTNPTITQYSPDQGLPKGEVHVFSAAGHIVFATEKGLFRFDDRKNTFIPDPLLGEKFAGGSTSVFRIAEDLHKTIWFHSRQINYRAVPQVDGTYNTDDTIFCRLFRTQANAIYPDANDQFTWFATNKGLIRYDLSVKKNIDCPFQALIRKVSTRRTAIFEGCKNKETNNVQSRPPRIDYTDRNLRFEFAAPFFEAESETMYQCKLEGYEKDWNDWSKETWKDYTNVDPGQKIFHVRAKNVYGTISSEDTFEFEILTPWYQTGWAFSFYILTGLFMMFFIIKWRSRVLVREKQHLEQIIRERTKEIKRQSEKLEEMANAKSRFFANISHEFRTPLTLILGPLEQMLTSPQEKEKEQKRKMRLMLRNSQRLLNLINQLLDLSKFDSGTMKLQACRQNVVPFLKGIFNSFDSLAEQNDQVLTFYAAADEILLYFDPPRLEEIMVNLLSNAVKFTPAGGQITMTVGVTTGGAAGDFLEISVRDTGPGIPEDQLTHIFDRFYQADSTYEHHHKGSGIGLSIAKEIVELHHGTISAHSICAETGETGGAEFVVRLPMGDAHLKPNEIVEKSAAAWKIPDEASEAPEITKLTETPAGRRKINGLYMPGVADTGEYPTLIPDVEQLTTNDGTGKDIILVVEDSVDMRLYIRGALEPLYTVVEANDGQQGLQKAHEIIPDLVICDVMMPVMDGYDACRALKADVAVSHIPIILLTAKAGEESIVAGLECGADDYITKPFSTKILCARIKNLIDLRRQLQDTLKREMTLQPVNIKVSPVDEEFLKDLYKVLAKNMSDSDFNVENLSRKLYMNRVTLYRKINALTGENPTDFIRSYRLKRGAELLKTTEKSVLEVALDVGFGGSSYFIKCFKEKFHQSPSEYQRTEKMKADEGM